MNFLGALGDIRSVSCLCDSDMAVCVFSFPSLTFHHWNLTHPSLPLECDRLSNLVCLMDRFLNPSECANYLSMIVCGWFPVCLFHAAKNCIFYVFSSSLFGPSKSIKVATALCRRFSVVYHCSHSNYQHDDGAVIKSDNLLYWEKN